MIYEPGDLILSYKAPKSYDLISRFFNWKVKRHAINVFGKDCIFPECNHVRIVLGSVSGIGWVFHWTFPTARFERVQSWMADPFYSMVMRDKRGPLPQDPLMNCCLNYDGGIYDLGDLVATGFKLPFGIGFGKDNYFCSAGVYAVRDLMGRTDPTKTKTERIPPCNWANFDIFERVNGIDGVAMRPEPEAKRSKLL